MTDKHLLQIRKWRKAAKQNEEGRNILASMIDHLGEQINEQFPGTLGVDVCYGDIIDAAVRKMHELKRSTDVQDKPKRPKRKSSSKKQTPDSERGDAPDSVHREADENHQDI